MTAESRTFFNENINISYVDESLPEPDNNLVFKHYICSVIVYSCVFAILSLNPFFEKRVSFELQSIFLYGLMAYLVLAPLIYLVFRPKSLWKSHNVEIVNYFTRVIKSLRDFRAGSADEFVASLQKLLPSYYEKQALVLIFIKVFFGSIMVGGIYNNFFVLGNALQFGKNIFAAPAVMSGEGFSRWVWLKDLIVANREFLYTTAVTILFTIDLSVFAVGYLTEMSILKNKIRSVDATPAGLIFCLLCYPPFNEVTHSFLGWNQRDCMIAFHDNGCWITWIFRFAAIIFLSIYVLASVALGTKASNLTNRGTVSCFPYNIIRHPAYISKNLFWLFTTLPVFFVVFSGVNIFQYLTKLILVLAIWAIYAAIYYMRALTEERHLLKDPDYQEYVKKVKYRFIPYLV